jgi:hypothetical protein
MNINTARFRRLEDMGGTGFSESEMDLCVCLLLQDLLQSCSRGGEEESHGEDMCYHDDEISESVDGLFLRSPSRVLGDCVDESKHRLKLSRLFEKNRFHPV